MAMENIILAIIKAFGPAILINGLISKLQKNAVIAASNIFSMIAIAHEDPRAPLRVHPPQNMGSPITTKRRPSKRPVRKTPKPEALRTKPITKRKIEDENNA